MSTTRNAQSGSATSTDGEDHAQGGKAEPTSQQSAAGDASAGRTDQEAASETMRDGALARTARGRDLAARRARALRSAGIGMAAGSAAGATAAGATRAAGTAGGTGEGTMGRATTAEGGVATADATTRVAPPRQAAGQVPGSTASAAAAGTAAGGQRIPGSTARTGNAVRSPRQQKQAAPRRGGPRRVRLTAQRVDPWSVLKISFLVSFALGIAGVVMVAVLWTVLSGMDVFSTVNNFFIQVTSGETGPSRFDLMDYLGFGQIISIAAMLAVLNVFLLTALATLSAIIYNICAALVGGAQITLSDE